MIGALLALRRARRKRDVERALGIEGADPVPRTGSATDRVVEVPLQVAKREIERTTKRETVKKRRRGARRMTKQE
jgi:hypothetical protein